MRNRNFLLQKNTACQAVFTALTSGIEVLNIVISNKLVGLFVVVVVDGIHLIQQGFPVQSAAGAQGFQRIVIIPKLGIYITKQNHRIFWYHKTWTPFLFLYLLLFTPFTVTRFAMHRNHAFAWFRAAILGFSVNFVHKKRLAECYQWTVTTLFQKTGQLFREYGFLYISMIQLRK